MSFPELAEKGTTAEILRSRRAMATEVLVRLPLPALATPEQRRGLEEGAMRALEVFAEVERTCTRFDPRSALMRANRSPGRWHRVPLLLYQAIAEAARAHEVTEGRMDPRVLRRLVALGYDRTRSFGDDEEEIAVAEEGGGGDPTPTPTAAWRPGLRRCGRRVRIGDEPIDLGGIGKGLALRWAALALRRHASDFLLDAGGDGYCAGTARAGEAWRVGIEDPFGGQGPLAVLGLGDLAVATSSVRLRRWRANGVQVHHLIDPTTGQPGGCGLRAVTVVGPDPASAEVWAKALFLAGEAGIASLAKRHRLAALWVDDAAGVGLSPGIEEHLIWRRP